MRLIAFMKKKMLSEESFLYHFCESDASPQWGQAKSIRQILPTDYAICTQIPEQNVAQYTEKACPISHTCNIEFIDSWRALSTTKNR